MLLNQVGDQIDQESIPCLIGHQIEVNPTPILLHPIEDIAMKTGRLQGRHQIIMTTHQEGQNQGLTMTIITAQDHLLHLDLGTQDHQDHHQAIVGVSAEVQGHLDHHQVVVVVEDHQEVEVVQDAVDK